MADIKQYIRTISDFPKPGIEFRDVTTLFQNPEGLSLAISQSIEAFADRKIDYVAGIEARGFVVGGALAQALGAGFVLLRKKGKLPGATIGQNYALEYGTATLEMHVDAIEAGSTVLVVDDLLATGGTAEAAIHLIERQGGRIVALSFLIDLPDLGGSARLRSLGYDVHCLCAFEGH